MARPPESEPPAALACLAAQRRRWAGPPPLLEACVWAPPRPLWPSRSRAGRCQREIGNEKWSGVAESGGGPRRRSGVRVCVMSVGDGHFASCLPRLCTRCKHHFASPKCNLLLKSVSHGHICLALGPEHGRVAVNPKKISLETRHQGAKVLLTKRCEICLLRKQTTSSLAAQQLSRHARKEKAIRHQRGNNR